MEWMEKLKKGIERIEVEGVEALTSVRAEAMSFFDHLKQLWHAKIPSRSHRTEMLALICSAVHGELLIWATIRTRNAL